MYLLSTGFDKAQAETIVSALTTLSNVSLDSIYKEMVTRAQQVIFSLLSIVTISFSYGISVNPPTCQTYLHLSLYKGTKEQKQNSSVKLVSKEIEELEES